LFGRRRGLRRTSACCSGACARVGRELAGAARRLSREGGAPFFAFESPLRRHPGAARIRPRRRNPPWVRGERGPPRYGDAGNPLCHVAASARPRVCAPARLAVAFVERALELAPPVERRHCSSPRSRVERVCGAAAKAARRKTRLERVAPIAQLGAFGAAVYPNGPGGRAGRADGRERVATALGPKTGARRFPSAASRSTVRDPCRWATRIMRHANRLCDGGRSLEPAVGVKTGADEVFLVAQPGPATRPVVRGRDLRPWRATPRAHMLWTHGARRPAARPPPGRAGARARPHVERLCRRSDYRRAQPGGCSVSAPSRRPTPRDLAGPRRLLAAVVPDAGVVPLTPSTAS